MSSPQPTDSFTGDFELRDLTLTTVDGKEHNFRFLVTEINVYEDIWSNHISCDILVNDATNMLQNLPIYGFEKLRIEFCSKPEKKIYTKNFRLVNITDRKLIRERQAGYILHFVSEEAITNLKTRVSKSYKGKLISEIAKDIHTTAFQGEIDVEETQYQQHIIIPKLNPCHAINWLATRANSTAYKGANFLYYQDKDKYRFVSMESRLAQSTIKYYTFQVANIRKDGVGTKPQDLDSNVIAIRSYTFDRYSSIIDNMQNGMYGNELYTHSTARKLWERHTFNYMDSFDTYKHLYEENLLYNDIFKDAQPDSKLKLHSSGHDLDGYPVQPELWLPCRISQLQQLQNIKVVITIPGDSERTVGEVVELRIPSPEPPIDNRQIDDRFYSGRFLVEKVRHKIDMTKYLTVLELVKDSTLYSYK